MTRAAKVSEGIAVAIWEVPALDAIAGETLVAAPDGVEVGWAWDGTSWVAPAPDVVAAKAVKLREMQAALAAAMAAPVTALDATWDADQQSRDLLGQAITLASAGLPLPASWRTADNSTVTVTGLPMLLAIAGAMTSQVQAAYAIYWARKAEVEAAETVEALAEITWEG